MNEASIAFLFICVGRKENDEFPKCKRVSISFFSMFSSTVSPTRKPVQHSRQEWLKGKLLHSMVDLHDSKYPADCFFTCQLSITQLKETLAILSGDEWFVLEETKDHPFRELVQYCTMSSGISFINPRSTPLHRFMDQTLTSINQAIKYLY